MTTTEAPTLAAALKKIVSAASSASVSTSGDWTTFHLRLPDDPRFRSVGFHVESDHPGSGDEADNLLGWLHDLARAEGLHVYSALTPKGTASVTLAEGEIGPKHDHVARATADDLATALALALAEVLAPPSETVGGAA